MTAPEPRPLVRMAEAHERLARQARMKMGDFPALEAAARQLETEARLLRAADAVIEKVSAEAIGTEYYACCVCDGMESHDDDCPLLAYRAAEKEVQGHDGD